ncbi:MAG: flagellar basal body L-ring protein FlgH [Thermoguttaceae bacterium]
MLGLHTIGRTCLGACLALGLAGQAAAQSGSLWGNPQDRKPLTMAESSWTYQQVLEPKQLIKLHDLVTVSVHEKSQMTTNGKMDQYKTIQQLTTLTNWINLHGGNLVAQNPTGTAQPSVGGTVNNQYQAQANLQEKDSLEFSIACEVVDLRPNGTLVVEGHRKIQVNDEEWEFSLSGIVRPEDLMPNNTVPSEKIADLRIYKRQAGHGRDGIRRGWLQKWMDEYQLF